jgi:uncharacterized protein (TIGR00730 family)
MDRVCVYAGSNPGRDPAYMESAAALGGLLARRGIGLVYGGAKAGLMGALADAALAEDGEVVGVMPQALIDREIGHPGLSGMHIVGSMHERKAMMAELSGGFIALPGGAGTLEELIEMFTWLQLGFHRKPIGVLNVSGYYDGLAALFDHAVQEEFVRPPHRAALVIEADAERLLDRFATWEAPAVKKWVEPGVGELRTPRP